MKDLKAPGLNGLSKATQPNFRPIVLLRFGCYQDAWHRHPPSICICIFPRCNATILINWGEKQNLGLVLQQGNNVHVQPIESFSVTNIHPHTGRRQTRRNICVSNPCTEEAFGHIHTQEAFVLPTNKNKLLYYQHYVALVTAVSL